MLVLVYRKCSTCQKAKKWLDDHKISYDDRHIVEQNGMEEVECRLRNFSIQAACSINR